MQHLQRHPLSMSTRFRDAIVLTYAFPEETLRSLVPAALALETRDDVAFVAVAVVDMRQLRPSGLPRWAGTDAIFVGYRVFVRTQLPGGRVRRGLKVVRTDVNRLHLLVGTRLLTRYDTGLVSASWQRDGRQQAVRIRSRWRGVDLDVETLAEVPPAPPPGSPFVSWSEAAPFSGPLPWTFAPDESGSSAVAVKGVRSDWRPQPITVRSHTVGFFAQAPFGGHRPVLASAFHVADIDYSWAAGKQEAISPPERDES